MTVIAHLGNLHFGGKVLMRTETEVEIVVCPAVPFVIRVPLTNVLTPVLKPILSAS